MKRGLFLALYGIACCVLSGAAGGFVFPYLDEVTRITPERVMMVRANGFTGTVTYTLDRVSGAESYSYHGTYPWKTVDVKFRKDCDCITWYYRRDEDGEYTVMFDPDKADGKVFYAMDRAKTQDGQRVILAWHRPIDDVQNELGEARMILKRAKDRFWEEIPKG